MDEPGPRSAVAFVRAIAMLALEADAQVQWLDELGVAPCADELALEFDDGLQLVSVFLGRAG